MGNRKEWMCFSLFFSGYLLALVFILYELFSKYGFRTETILLGLIYFIPSWFFYRLFINKIFSMRFFLKTFLLNILCFSVGLWIRSIWIKDNINIIFDRNDELAIVIGKLNQNDSFKNVYYEVSQKKILWVYGQVKTESELNDLIILLKEYRFGYVSYVKTVLEPMGSP